MTGPITITVHGQPAPRVVGLDLSLTSTGIAVIDGGDVTVRRAQPGKLRGHERMDCLAAEAMDAATSFSVVDLAVVEGPSFGSAARSAYAHEAAGLWWRITRWLWTSGIPYAIVPPATLKRYATGKGNAAKDAVLIAAVKRYPQVVIDGNDQADALILAAMGADHLGHPLATVPATHRAALAAVDWPGVTHG